jgi:eukaryotic-like serine/threonine-protein kinase
MSAAPTPRVGDYEIVGVLGSGGMGNVFKVRNVISDRIEAMKILLPDLAGQQELAERFLREIKVLGRLDHPNIAALRTALSWDNRLVMIMEYVEGVSLAARLEQGPLAPRDAVDYTEQVLGALAYAHRLHIIHRDIKPANIILTPQGTVKLMDFGIARCDNDASLTTTGTTLGSLYYMSPEQVKGEPADERSDLYSLGVSLYEMVTGKRPFEADSNFAIMAAHLQRQPEPPIELRIDLPAGLNEIILQAMAKDPAQRFQSADEFCKALKNLQVSLSTPAKDAATTLGDSVNAAMLDAVTAPGQSLDARDAASKPAHLAAGVGAQSRFSAQLQTQPPVRVQSSPAAQVQAPLPTQKVEGVPPISAKYTAHRGLYISLGALIVLLVLVAGGIYFPRRNSTHAGSDARVEPSSPYKPELGQSKELAPPATVSPSDSGNPRTSSQPGATQVTTDSYPNGAGGSGTIINSGRQTAASSGKRNMWSNAGLRGRVQPEKQGGLSDAPGSTALSPAAAESGQLEQLAHDFELLSSRADSVNDSLTTLRETQRAQGLGLRGDIASSQERMQRFVARAQSALRNQDARDAKKYLDLAETEVTNLEKYLGH